MSIGVINFGVDLVPSRTDLKRISVKMYLEDRFNVCLYDKFASYYLREGCKSVRPITDKKFLEEDTDCLLVSSHVSLDIPVYVQSDDGTFYELSTYKDVDISKIHKGVVLVFDIPIFDKLVKTRSRTRNIYFVLFCSQDDYTSNRLTSEVSLETNILSLEITKGYEDSAYMAVPVYSSITDGLGILDNIGWDSRNIFDGDEVEVKYLRKAIRGLIYEFVGKTKQLTPDRYKNYYAHLVWFSPDFFDSVRNHKCSWCQEFNTKALNCIYEYNTYANIYADSIEAENPLPLIGFSCGANAYDFKTKISSQRQYYFKVAIDKYKSAVTDEEKSELRQDFKFLTKNIVVLKYKDWYFSIKLDYALNKKQGIVMFPVQYIKDGYILIYETKLGTYYRCMRIVSNRVDMRDDFRYEYEDELYHAKSQEQLKRLMLLV